MNLFSKLFSTSSSARASHEHADRLSALRTIFKDEGEFFSSKPLFHQHAKEHIEYIFIHPNSGLSLINFFDYHAKELSALKASPAGKKDKKAQVRTRKSRDFIQLRFDEVFHTQRFPLRSVLICENLSEEEFDGLDESFHALIPKSLTLFSDSDTQRYRELFLGDLQEQNTYDTGKIKEALFPELIIPEQNSLMSKQQQEAIHQLQEKRVLIHGLPGTGKSSLLVARGLYEKMQNPKLRLILFGKRPCHVHHLQSMIFEFIENSHWSLNPADITVSSFESLQRRSREKESYDLILCDDINPADLETLESLLSPQGQLFASSYEKLDGFHLHELQKNYRLSPALCAACQGFEVEQLEESLTLQSGNTFMNTLLILEKLMKEAKLEDISIVHHDKEALLKLQQEIDGYFEPISYLHDDPDRQDGLLLYPLSQIGCILKPFVIIIIDENSQYDPVELISRADQQCFILSEDEEAENILTKIKGDQNESD